jgi:hypothetical protein
LYRVGGSLRGKRSWTPQAIRSPFIWADLSPDSTHLISRNELFGLTGEMGRSTIVAHMKLIRPVTTAKRKGSCDHGTYLSQCLDLGALKSEFHEIHYVLYDMSTVDMVDSSHGYHGQSFKSFIFVFDVICRVFLRLLVWFGLLDA